MTLSSGKIRSRIGTRIDDYQILRSLGRGGMAEVYAARQLSLGRDVAIKLMRPDLAGDRDYVDRFRREATAAARLNHPHIVSVYGVGTLAQRRADGEPGPGIPYIVQELIDGENYAERLKRLGVISPAELYSVMVAVGSALGEAAAAGITHRDIKPDNLMRSRRGQIKVADFGLARLATPGDTVASLTKVGLTLGTPRYMSPEQIRGAEVDLRSDLYSLGVTAFELMCGRPPFEAADPVALAVKHAQEVPPPVLQTRREIVGRESPDAVEETLRDTLVDAITTLLAKSPSDRFQTPADLLAALGQDVDSAIHVASPSLVARGNRLQRAMDRRQNTIRKRRRRVAVVAAVGMVAAVASFVTVRQIGRDPIQARLRPEVVPKQSTVGEQFLLAMSRQDEAGFKAVQRFFPDADQYIARSRYQWARLVWQTGDAAAARRELRPVVDDFETPDLLRMAALVLDYQLASAGGAGPPIAEVRTRLIAQYKTIRQSRPEDLDFLARLIPADIRSQLELEVDL